LKKKRGNFCLFQKGNFLLSFFRIFSSSSSSSSFPLLPKRIIFSRKIKGWREELLCYYYYYKLFLQPFKQQQQRRQKKRRIKKIKVKVNLLSSILFSLFFIFLHFKRVPIISCTNFLLLLLKYNKISFFFLFFLYNTFRFS
jgi:hypothetical protein